MAAHQTIELPSIGDYRDVPVVEVLVKPGDVVKLDDPLVVLETEKATIEVPSPAAGTILEMLVEVGKHVSEGQSLAVIDAQATAAAPVATVQAEPQRAAKPDPEPAAARQPAAPAPQLACPTPPAAPASGPKSSSGAHASPSVRAFARELRVKLDEVKASGRKGRILREDVLAFVRAKLEAPAQAATGLPAMPTYDFSRYGEVEHVPLTRIQQVSGTTLHRNWVNIPHVTNFDETDVTDIEAFRVALNAEKRDPKVKATMVAFLVKASALALREHPRFNSSLAGNDLVMKKYVHVGVAVDTPRGLLVPVIRDCDRKGLIEIAAEIAALAEKTRDGKLAPSDMEGGCFSVSSLGGIGGTGFTPIINSPEVAILGAARSQMLQRWDGREFRPRLIMPVSLSWDHRVVDGVAAARFLNTLVSILGDFRRASL